MKTASNDIPTQYLQTKCKAFINKIPSHSIHENIMHEYYNANKEHISNTRPQAMKPHIPSILNSTMPPALLRYCR